MPPLKIPFRNIMKKIIHSTVICASILICLNAAGEQKKFAQISGDWENADNWEPPGVPCDQDDVLIQNAEVISQTAAESASITLEAKDKNAMLKVLGMMTTGLVKIGGPSESTLSYLNLLPKSELIADRIEMAPSSGDALLNISNGSSINLKEGKGEILGAGGQGKSSILFGGEGSLPLAKCHVSHLTINGGEEGEGTLEILPGQHFKLDMLTVAANPKGVGSNYGRLNINGGEVEVDNIKLNVGPPGSLTTSVLQLNSGTLKASNIFRYNDGADQVFEWNGGTLAKRENETGEPSNLFLGAISDQQKPLEIRLGAGDKQNFEVNHDTAVISPRAILTNNGSAKGTLVKTGDGTLDIQSKCTYSGLTTIKAGVLRVSGSGSISDSAGVVVQRAGDFEYQSTEPEPQIPGWLKNAN